MYSRLRWRANANGIQTRFGGGLIVWYSMSSHGKHGVHYVDTVSAVRWQ